MIRRVGDVLMYNGGGLWVILDGWGWGLFPFFNGSYDGHPPSDCQRRIEGKGFLSPGCQFRLPDFPPQSETTSLDLPDLNNPGVC